MFDEMLQWLHLQVGNGCLSYIGMFDQISGPVGGGLSAAC
jgi:hypothetical protein